MDPTKPEPDTTPGDASENGNMLPAESPEDARADRRALAALLWLQGFKSKEIAAKIGCGDSTIRADLAYVRQEWGAKTERKLAYHLGKALATLDALQDEFWQAWRESKVRSVRPGVGDEPARIETAPGDPRFLNGVLECVARTCKLLGLDAPDKVRIEAPVKLVSGVDMDAV